MRLPPLHDRVVLVTGAGRGIGRSIAMAAALDGAHVAIAYHSSEAGARELAEEIRAVGRDTDVHPCDVARREEVFALVDWAGKRFGRIDGLVNNAGIMPEAAFLDLTPEDWDLVLKTNLYGMFHASQAVLPGMLARGGGAIVNIASRLGLIGWPGVAHYASAKAGAMALAKSISREFGQRGIRANAVAPGVTNTAMGRTVMEGEVGRKRMLELPLGRFGEPGEVAECVTFLLSDAAGLLLGQTLHPNSGGLMP
ncbi:SDR family NAD(P)-dependent oxidoreductase [Actinomadura rudentiformis]|uniref:SDR family oxidoreductase n=1 Tax=Actinomadura rudentiformis TaxID=359158 RepID=A0A6H9YL03_9ACTN|nr:SDR family NAD(P)-dependent oxidoreductase [Actinomadura rudentiformis]KAB2347888.1 SDR family oxidoreductase [Actinomadura rudentiformis]